MPIPAGSEIACEISFVSSSWLRTSSIVASTLSTLLRKITVSTGVSKEERTASVQLSVNPLENICSLLHRLKRLLVHVRRLDRVDLYVLRASVLLTIQGKEREAHLGGKRYLATRNALQLLLVDLLLSECLLRDFMVTRRESVRS
jgi:hypothetical protein